MKVLGDNYVVSQGEDFTIDLDIRSKEGHPLVVFQNLENPFLVITMASRERPDGTNYTMSHWLDLSNIQYEQSDGTVVAKPIKKFLSTLPLVTSEFSIETILSEYDGMLVDDGESKNDVRNFLFAVDELNDGEYIYKYVSSEYGATEAWSDYFFRFMETFKTDDLSAGTYYYDINLVSGRSVYKRIDEILDDGETTDQFNAAERVRWIQNEDLRDQLKDFVDRGLPLIEPFNSNLSISDRHTVKIIANLKGGSY